jgi:hypothetical protein
MEEFRNSGRQEAFPSFSRQEEPPPLLDEAGFSAGKMLSVVNLNRRRSDGDSASFGG